MLDINGLPGWIDEVENGTVYGRLADDENDLFFEMPILSVPECQRVELEPGRYCSFLNGHLLIWKWQWTTHELEQASKRAKETWQALFGGKDALTTP